mmetsp:Transcript_9643/g.14522  ORF Transcript_9643/g.14522 Transcript_9643/m.14522 type:complete len:169 (+) Transcript_9643:33-539(+)|eukprot:CAMPEP_0201557492 /NCGR_PEP_ID=MMETSP0173_2-20130828/62201_1 /ASSEMBLY_ACC=CAM_ASM_000268 /TAXON_ID=218659 /ORGANISM="Vexillifera sp., Strain DIVA3 564/2" /LENGTH=168 /DNA_ID=CAMNT_0047970365 /DNA_START=44 /DNA_END=550 /DNA_ORIENTATION=-
MSSTEKATIQVGEELPEADFLHIVVDDEGKESVGSYKLELTNKKIILFGLPGAFTPTCSARHLPGFVEDYEKLKGKGVDAIYCISVNDPFVMHAWGKDQKVQDKVTLLADGGAQYVTALGLSKDTGKFGGIRSERFVLVAENGVVKHVAIDEQGKFEVSSSEAVLAFV